MAALQRRLLELARRPLPQPASQSQSQSQSQSHSSAGLDAPMGSAEEARGESEEGLTQLLLAAAANSQGGVSHAPAEADLSEHPAAEEGVVSSGAEEGVVSSGPSVEELMRQLREAP